MDSILIFFIFLIVKFFYTAAASGDVRDFCIVFANDKEKC